MSQAEREKSKQCQKELRHFLISAEPSVKQGVTHGFSQPEQPGLATVGSGRIGPRSGMQFLKTRNNLEERTQIGKGCHTVRP